MKIIKMNSGKKINDLQKSWNNCLPEGKDEKFYDEGLFEDIYKYDTPIRKCLNPYIESTKIIRKEISRDIKELKVFFF